MNFYEKLYQNGIVPVVKINRVEQAADLARALLAGGISVIELTYRSAAAGRAIRMIAREVPEICICAGTVLSQAQAKEALDAGAKAIVSPGTNERVVQYCLEKGVPVIPGVATPTEVEACMRLGLHTLKLFPAEVVGGKKYAQSVGWSLCVTEFYAYRRHYHPDSIGISFVIQCNRLWRKLDCARKTN